MFSQILDVHYIIHNTEKMKLGSKTKALLSLGTSFKDIYLYWDSLFCELKRKKTTKSCEVMWATMASIEEVNLELQQQQAKG